MVDCENLRVNINVTRRLFTHRLYTSAWHPMPLDTESALAAPSGAFARSRGSNQEEAVERWGASDEVQGW